MTPMPINTGDGELLSRSNELLKILSLSNFPFYILQCTQAFTADLQTSSSFAFEAKCQRKYLFSLLLVIWKRDITKKQQKLEIPHL